MSRIAPEPIDTGLTLVVGNRPRGRQGEREESRDDPAESGQQQSELTPSSTTGDTPPPVLPDPAGTAFAVALVAVDLPPIPPSPREITLRLPGAHWSPPNGTLTLTDRKA